MTTSELLSLIGCSLVATVGAAALGHFMGKWIGAQFLFVLSSIAGITCYLGVSYYGLQGLIGAVLIVTVLAAMLGYQLYRWRGARCIGSMWLGFCLACAFGYYTSGVIGLIMITLPSLVLPWACLYFVAQRVLPFSHNPTRTDRFQAFRSLLTYTLGTNYPYYTVENQKLMLRVPGNQFREFFAGPGIIITGCDHTVVMTDGVRIRGVKDPGLSFTGLFETVAEVIDLRVQLRAFHVEALTKDGIRVRVLASVPFRIDAGNDWPKLGEAFPFKKSAIFKAVQEQPIEYSQEYRDGRIVENRQKRTWDETVSMVAAQVVRRIIGEYPFDDLYSSDLSKRGPRQEITQSLQQQLKDELGPMGIRVIGGSIGNLLPANNQLLQQRIHNWRTGRASGTKLEHR